MFTDTEMMLMMMHKRNVSAVIADAQGIVDRKNDRIAVLEAALVREQRKNAGLISERGQRNAELLATRIGRRRH